MAEAYENVLEWLDGNDTISATLHQKKFVNRIKKLSEIHKDEVKIIAENDDGSIFVHLPLSYLKLNPKRQLINRVSDKSEVAERMARAREAMADKRRLRDEAQEGHLENR